MGKKTIERDTMKFIDIPQEERKAILDSLQSNIGLQTAIIYAAALRMTQPLLDYRDGYVARGES